MPPERSSEKHNRKSVSGPLRTQAHKVLKLAKDSSEDLTDSDFEPKSSQRLKPRLQKKRRSKDSSNETPSRDMDAAGPSHGFVTKVKDECLSSGRSTPNPLWVVMDSHVEDIGCISGNLTEQIANFKKRYLQQSWEDVMLPVAVKELEKYIKRAVQSLCEVSEDLRILSPNSNGGFCLVKTEKNPDENIVPKEEIKLNGEIKKEKEAGASGSHQPVVIDSDNGCSPQLETRSRRCGSTDSESGVPDVSRNGRRCGSVESQGAGSTKAGDSDNQDSNDLTGAVASAADNLGSSSDMFSDTDFPEQSEHQLVPTEDNHEKSEIAQSTKSLDCKANLLADSSSDSEPNENGAGNGINESAESGSDSDAQTVSPRRHKSRKPTFNVKDLDVYHSDIKLQEKCSVKITKLPEAVVEKHLELVGSYYDADASDASEESDNDEVKKLTNLNNLQRKGKSSDSDADDNSNHKATSKRSCKEKKNKSKEKEKLSDFLNKSETSEGEHSFETLPVESANTQKESASINDIHKKMLLQSSDSEDGDNETPEISEKAEEKCIEEKEESLLPASDAIETGSVGGDAQSNDAESNDAETNDAETNDAEANDDKANDETNDAEANEDEANVDETNDAESNGDKGDDDKGDDDKGDDDKGDDDKGDDDKGDDDKGDDDKGDDDKGDDDKGDDDKADEESDVETKPESKKKDWRKNSLLTGKLSDTDTSDEEKRWEKRKNMKKNEEKNSSDEEVIQPKKRKTAVSPKKKDSDVVVISDDPDSSSSEDFVKKKPKRAVKKSSSSSEEEEEKPKKKRRRIKVQNSSSDDEAEKNKDSESPNKGRKKIKHIISEEDLEKGTKEAAKEEEERLKRIAGRQKMYEELYDNVQKGFQVLDKLVLDFDEETKEPLVEVNKVLVKKLKPHQAKGVKFMWDACFESLKRIKKSEGSGCILAHCMGLGKTFQVVTLVHTLFSFPATKVERVLVVCPVSTVLNWVNEFHKWLDSLKNGPEIEVFEMTKCKQNMERSYKLREWMESGGVMVIGYDMYRNITNPQTKRVRASMMKTFQSALVNPGPDLVICDEGHLLKNEDTGTSKAMTRVRTLRRVILTGTPLQNNLKEYHCMVQFVKPNLLGTRKEFLNRFVNPITNGQFEDSTSHDVKKMKRRAHVLHKTLEGCVQRFDYSVLTPYLPAKEEYVISVRVTETQEKLYRHYLENQSARGQSGKGAQLFADFQQLQRIWTHPRVLKMSQERNDQKAEKEDQTDSEGSLVDFIDDGSDTPETSSSSSEEEEDDDDVVCLSDDEPKKKKTKKPPPTRRTRSKKDLSPEPEIIEPPAKEKEWWQEYVKDSDLEDLRESPKLQLLFSVLKDCEENGEKLLVFSQSLFSLDVIEYFLGKIDEATQRGEEDETLDGHKGSWSLGMDYFRLDGSTPTELRSTWCNIFNRASNIRARLFLISTRAGGLGINLVAANRVIIFDASWNPSHDVQSIFRVYRFGQTKPCFIYRFLAQGTMEEKIYERQVTKLSLACRVVDELQVERYYKMADLQELYTFTPADRDIFVLPKLPKDHLFAELLKKHKSLITTYHEHDSLLENKEEEELNEDERKAAWEDYENEKKGPIMQQAPYGGIDLPTLDQLRETVRLREPHRTDQEVEEMAATAYRQMILFQQKQQQQYLAMQRQQYQLQMQRQQQQLQLQQQQQLQLQQQQQFGQAQRMNQLLLQDQVMQNYQQNFHQQPYQYTRPMQQATFNPLTGTYQTGAQLPSTSMASHSRQGFAQQPVNRRPPQLPSNPQKK